MGKGMSGPMAMDHHRQQVSEGAAGGAVVAGRGCGGGGPLGVNKASSKIAKGLRRGQPVAAAAHQAAAAAARAAPQIYKTAPGDFRSLVQQLTGSTTSSSSFSPAGSSSPAATKPAVSRLQRIAPPPLRPTFTYPTMIPPGSFTSSNPKFGGPRLSSSPQNFSAPKLPFPVSPLYFSPLPALTPSDRVWASSLSSSSDQSPPDGALLRQTLESAVEAGKGEEEEDNNNNNNHLRLKSSLAAAAADAPPPPPPFVSEICHSQLRPAQSNWFGELWPVWHELYILTH